jgi:hypothetical protein
VVFGKQPKPPVFPFLIKRAVFYFLFDRDLISMFPGGRGKRLDYLIMISPFSFGALGTLHAFRRDSVITAQSGNSLEREAILKRER